MPLKNWLKHKSKKLPVGDKTKKNKKNLNIPYENVPDKSFTENWNKFINWRQQRITSDARELKTNHDTSYCTEISYYENVDHLQNTNMRTKYDTPLDDVAHQLDQMIITDLDASLNGGIVHATPVQLVDDVSDHLNDPKFSSDLDNEQNNGQSKYHNDILIISPQQLQLNSNIRHGCLNSFAQNGDFRGMPLSVLQSHHSNDYNVECHNFEILRKCRHPNIVLLVGLVVDDYSKIVGLLVEPIKCSLFSIIYPKRRCIPLRQCYKYITQLISAVNYLHLIKIVHTSICTENVVITQTGHLVKLAGFEMSIPLNGGICCTAPHQQIYRQHYTKHFYQAPECLMDHFSANETSDTYGLCMLLWELINCNIPFVEYNRKELREAFATEQAQLPVLERRRYKPFKKLLQQGLRVKQSERFPNVFTLEKELKRLKDCNWESFETGARHDVPATFKVDVLDGSDLLTNYNINIKVRSPRTSQPNPEDFYIDDDFEDTGNVNLGLTSDYDSD